MGSGQVVKKIAKMGKFLFAVAVSKNVFPSKTERFRPMLGLPPAGLGRIHQIPA